MEPQQQVSFREFSIIREWSETNQSVPWHTWVSVAPMGYQVIPPKLELPTRIFSLSGKMPIPTLLSSKKQRLSTRSCRESCAITVFLRREIRDWTCLVHRHR